MIGFPNRVDSATLSGGSWSSSLPRSNLQSRVLGKVARTANVTTAATQFDIDLGSDMKVRVFAVVNHNFSLFATYRLRGSTVSNFASTVYDSGATFVDVWPVVYPSESLDWEDSNWWGGKYTAEQIEGYTRTLVVVLPANVTARHWRFEVNDTTNAAGYLDMGRVFIGPVWQPANNMSYGAANGWETKTDVQEALGGAEYFQRRTPYRVARFSLNWMSEDEGMANAFELQRRAGIDQDVLWIHDPDDTVHALRRQFLGRLRQLSPIEYPYPLTQSAGFEIKEIL